MPPAVAIAESGSGGEGANAAAAQKDGEEKLVPTLLQPAAATTADTATNTTTTSETALPSKRKRKTRQADPYFIHEPVKRKTVAKKKKKLNAEEEFASFWICSECKEAECMMKPEADKLLICEGACRRLFHYPCAGLSELPAEDESYVCGDCQSDKHPCSFCHCYGVDNEDVFLCSKDGCGLFFHESCLSMQNVEVERSRVEETESPSEDVGVGESDDAPAETCRFVCPAHSCWTCTQKDAKEQERAGKGAPKKKGRKKKSKGNGSAFDCKSDSMLTRCMECPISYHVTCIPPPALFHELALLCHKHAATTKLPELDAETSMAVKIEKSIDKKFEQLATKREKKVQSDGSNPFFQGISGDKETTKESKLLEKLEQEGNGLAAPDLMFCLPCDIKDEVYAIPPSFRSIMSLKFDPANRPPRTAASGDSCGCQDFCGDDCLNRMLYVECFGDSSKEGNKNKHSNCKVGLKCGNRQLGQRKFSKCKPQREHGKGWGLTVVEKALRGSLIQEYVGEVIDEKTKEQRLSDWVKEHPNDPNFYVMALTPGWFIDARHEANFSRFINHSCDPNCILLPINVGGHRRNGVFAKRDLGPGEFLSYDYQFDTRQGDRFSCRCGAKKCRGTMKGGGGPMVDSAVKKTKNEMWQDAKARFDRDKRFLEEFTVDEEERSHQVGAAVPGAENKDELVANGVRDRYRDTIVRNRICLWRNAVGGSDFVARWERLQKKA